MVRRREAAGFGLLDQATTGRREPPCAGCAAPFQAPSSSRQIRSSHDSPHPQMRGIARRETRFRITPPLRIKFGSRMRGCSDPRREVKRRPRTARSERLFENDYKRRRFRPMALGAPFCYTPGNYVQSACEEVFPIFEPGRCSGAGSGSLGRAAQFPAFPAAGRKMSCLVVRCFSCLSLR